MEVVIPIECDLREEELIKKLKEFDKYPIETKVLGSTGTHYLVKIISDEKELFYFGNNDKSRIAMDLEKYFENNKN
ncbi:MAG: hypothetical protein J7L08_02315 [Candidatus Aenigmarchaeota archaeon]|nr:hypothetical protein [Candidatus Aenigmarchaeota archaeon]